MFSLDCELLLKAVYAMFVCGCSHVVDELFVNLNIFSFTGVMRRRRSV